MVLVVSDSMTFQSLDKESAIRHDDIIIITRGPIEAMDYIRNYYPYGESIGEIEFILIDVATCFIKDFVTWFVGYIHINNYQSVPSISLTGKSNLTMCIAIKDMVENFQKKIDKAKEKELIDAKS